MNGQTAARIGAVTLFLVLLVIFTGCGNKNLNEHTLSSNGSKINESEEQHLPRVRGADYYYCTGLGYKYEMRIVDNRSLEYCIFPDGTECDSFDFITGECGREHSLCELKGYTLKIGIEQHEGFNKTYAVCLFPDRSYCKEIDFFNKKCHVGW